MNPFQPFYNMKIGVVDLSASSAGVIPLDKELVIKHLGGAAMNSAILEQYQGDPLIFGTGPLTGSFAPSSSLMVASLVSPIFKRLCHIPFMLRTGPDMKFSGVDCLVVKGSAPEQSILHVNRGKIQILSAGNLQHLPVPEAIRELKKKSPPFQSLMMTGPAADRGVSFASVSIGPNGSLDKVGLASLIAKKNLKGIMLGGMDGLPFNSNNPYQGKELEKKISTDNNFKHRGFFSVLKKLDGGKYAGKSLKTSRKKDMACYHCPSPCMTHVTYSWHDPRDKETQDAQDGLLLLDHMGCVALAKKAGNNILPVLNTCLYYGLDPAGVAERLPEGGTLPEYFHAIDKIMSDNPPHTTGVPEVHCRFGGGVPPILAGDLWNKRVGLAMILGVCPIFLLLFPQITDADLLAFISTSEDVLETLRDSLSSTIDSLSKV
jgi:aldehyde:ferredoxin oxidoreductase